MDDKTQIALLKAQGQAMDMLLDAIAKPRKTGLAKAVRIVFCSAPDQVECPTCADRLICREWQHKPRELVL